MWKDTLRCVSRPIPELTISMHLPKVMDEVLRTQHIRKIAAACPLGRKDKQPRITINGRYQADPWILEQCFLCSPGGTIIFTLPSQTLVFIFLLVHCLPIKATINMSHKEAVYEPEEQSDCGRRRQAAERPFRKDCQRDGTSGKVLALYSAHLCSHPEPYNVPSPPESVLKTSGSDLKTEQKR